MDKQERSGTFRSFKTSGLICTCNNSISTFKTFRNSKAGGGVQETDFPPANGHNQSINCLLLVADGGNHFCEFHNRWSKHQMRVANTELFDAGGGVRVVRLHSRPGSPCA